MPPNRLWELLARKYNNELTTDEQEELDQLLKQHQDTFELNETFTRLRDLDVRPLTTSADEERSRQSIAARLSSAVPATAPPAAAPPVAAVPGTAGTSASNPSTAVPAETAVQSEPTIQSAPTVQSAATVLTPVSPTQQDHARAGKPRTVRWIAAAAIFTTIAVSAVLIYRSKPAPATALSASRSEVATSKSKSKIQLPDGSVVMLNKQSKLAYNKDFGINKREITLTGEAYFDIAKNENAPLTVSAGSIKIVVMGTSFNVRAYTDDSIIETALIKGSIAVSSADDPDRIIRMHPNEKLTFGKDLPASPVTINGQQPAIKKSSQNYLVMNKIKANPIDSTINEIVWLQDKLVFSREPFYSVAQKMERWFQVRIRFRDKISEQLTLTGSLEKESLTEALDALRQLTPFNYQIDNGIVTISKKTNPI